jgi:hypothetical protein
MVSMQKNKNKSIVQCGTGTAVNNFNFWIAIIGLVLVIAIVAAIRIRLLTVPLERDEGEYAYAGQLILKGILPYHAPSLYKYKLPGIYFLYAAILYLFGQTTAGIHISLLLANLASVILIYFLMVRLFDRISALLAAVFFAVLSLDDAVLGMYAHAEHFVLLFVLAGTLLLLHALKTGRFWQFFLSACLFGTSYIIRQHGLVFCAFACFYLVALLSYSRLYTWRKSVFIILLYIAGIIFPFFIICVVFASAGLFDKFWFWSFVYARKYLSLVSPTIGFITFRHNFTAIIRSEVLIWSLAGIGFFVILLSTKLRGRIFFVVSFFVFSFLSVCPGLYFRNHYFILLLPAASILAAITFYWMLNYLKVFNCHSWAKYLSFLVVVISLFTVFYLHRYVYFFLTPSQVSTHIYGYNPFNESVEIARYIKSNSTDKDTVAVLGSEPQILFYADRMSATGYTDTYELMKKHDFALEMQNEMIAEIVAAKPKFLVFVNISYSWLARKDSVMKIFDWAKTYCSDYYDIVGVATLFPNGHTSYRWDRQINNDSPSTKYWIAVYQRKQ